MIELNVGSITLIVIGIIMLLCAVAMPDRMDNPRASGVVIVIIFLLLVYIAILLETK